MKDLVALGSYRRFRHLIATEASETDVPVSYTKYKID